MISTSIMSISDDKPDAKALRERQRVIGARLQAVYEDILSEGLPDDLQRLLAKLDRMDASAAEEDDAADDKSS